MTEEEDADYLIESAGQNTATFIFIVAKGKHPRMLSITIAEIPMTLWFHKLGKFVQLDCGVRYLPIS